MGRPRSTDGDIGTDPTRGCRRARDHGATWLIRSIVSLAAAMLAFGSESTVASSAVLDRPPPGLTGMPDLASPNSRIPGLQPDRGTIGDAPVGEPQQAVDEQRTDPAAAPESDRETAEAADPTDIDSAKADSADEGPADSEAVDPLTRPVVVLYGDSLAWEARHIFEQALGDQPVEVVTRTFGGTAICDWHDEMADDAALLQPGLVIFEFVGNNYTPCMQDAAGEPLTGAALADRYAVDAEAAIATFATTGTQVVLAGAPISRPATASLDLHHAPLNAVYEELGQRLEGVRYADTGSALLDDGAWTATLPCLPVEPCTGALHNVVRSPDGLHFCPSVADAPRGVTGDCPVWSSGAFRFGTALARPVLESLAAMTSSAADEV